MRKEGAPTRRVRLLGVAFDALTEDQAVDRVLGASHAGRGGFVCFVNVDVLRRITRDANARALVAPADLALADGMPIVALSRLQGDGLPGRVAGSSFISRLSEASAARGRSIFLLGGNPGAAEAAAVALHRRSRTLRCAGVLCPPFGFEHQTEHLGRIREALVAARPDIVFVGLGFPKQEMLISRLRDALPSTWFVSSGISFSFLAGEVRRAPAWMQRTGLEWLHRLAQEPGRLFRRYLIDDLPFLARGVAEVAGDRLGRPRR